MTLAPSDERAHASDAAQWWWESWHLDAATTDGVGLSVRLACSPPLGVAWWWTHLILPDVPGPVVVRDHEVGLPRQGLEVRADGLWGELWCETPFEHWTYSLEAFAVRLDDPADSLHDEIGERMPVGLDIEWEVDPGGVPHEYRTTDAERGYEQFGVVHGEVLLGRSRFELDAIGVRSHTWGVPRFDRSVRAAWLHAPDLGISFTATDEDVDGYVARGEATTPIAAARSETHRDARGLPVAARHVLDDDVEIDVEVVGLVTVPLVGAHEERAVLARAFCRYALDGGPESLIGWSSWLDPE